MEERSRLEKQMEASLLSRIVVLGKADPRSVQFAGAPLGTRADMQVFTCIDEREDSYRRHLEQVQ